MTTSPVVTITEELIAELEKESWLCDSDTSMFMYPATISALLAERAELKRDAARLGWVFGEASDLRQWRQKIDASMQAAQ